MYHHSDPDTRASERLSRHHETTEGPCMNASGVPGLRAWHAFAALVALTAMGFAARSFLTRPYAFLPDDELGGDGRYAYDVPLDPESPWPKFRANAIQNGRSPAPPSVDTSRRPWEFKTGKGVFSSPVVDADGTAYIGSADRHFYAINRAGELLWKFETGEVIDSSALLDDRGRVYFGSGDAHLYALDRGSGQLLWKFKADPVEVVEERYGIESFNVDWFEGNVAMLEDGTLIAPNDNFLIYAVDRDRGHKKAEYLGNELMWSLPAVNTRTGRIFAGSQFPFWRNVYAFETATRKRAWTSGGWGSNAASPLLTSRAPEGALIMGGYDGFVRAYSQENGTQLWKRGVRDHIYSSPAQLSDGTIIQPATDGTIYALDPQSGEVKWAHDTLGPIRSSPAVAAHDRIYLGTGEGRLFSINPDGSLRWSYLLIEEERNDLNGSPALGPGGITIAGQNGGVFHVPWDYPLTGAGRRDPRTVLGPGEALPGSGVFLIYTKPFGRFRVEPPETIDANQPLTFTLFVRKDGDTVKAMIDTDSLGVEVSGAPDLAVEVAADAQFLTLVPTAPWTGPEGGSIRVAIQGSYRSNPWRFGLKFFGASLAGRLDRSFSFDVAPRRGSEAPYLVPRKGGDPASVFELSRFAAPNPTMLPSWNQIGFDSLHYLAGVVDGTPEAALVWVVAGTKQQGKTVVDPDMDLRFPLTMEYDQGLLTFQNDDGFKINFVGSWDMPFGFYRASTVADPQTGAIRQPGALVAVAHCNDLEYYGNFLKLMGIANARTGHMAVFGGLDLALHQGDEPPLQAEIGSVRFSRDASSATATISGGALRRADHVFSLLLVDAGTGTALPLYYTKGTAVKTKAEGLVTSVSVAFGDVEVPDRVRAYYLVDTYPVARGKLSR
jgi:outer membrane protein assembly factor BamB